MASRHTPQVEPGRPHKYPLGVVDTWKDDNGVSQHIPIHPDKGCVEAGVEAGVDSCFKCPLYDCLGHDDRVLNEQRKKASQAAGE